MTEQPPATASEEHPIEVAVRAGYAFEGPALELGALMLDATTATDVPVRIPLGMLNRHGLVAGATGTGKTVTLQLLAEQLSHAGVPVFAADIKGDLSGISVAATGNDKIAARSVKVGHDWQARGCPVEYYAIGGEGTGIPLRHGLLGATSRLDVHHIFPKAYLKNPAISELILNRALIDGDTNKSIPSIAFSDSLSHTRPSTV